MAAVLGRVFTWSEPHSVAAFERRARAETALLGLAAALAALSVAVSLRNLDVLPRGEPAVIEESGPSDEPGGPGPIQAMLPSSLEEGASSRVALAPLATPEAPLDEPARPAPADRAAWRERDYYAEFSALPGPEELARRAAAVVACTGPKAEKMAALRVSFERDGQAAAALFVHAAAVLPDESDRQGESVPRAAIHWLGERAPSQPAARSVLESIARSREVRPELRAASVRALVAALPEEELPRVAAQFSRERDEIVYASAQAALDSRLDETPSSREAQQE